MSGAPPPYTGLATRLDRTMSDTTEATLDSRLAKAEDRVEELEAENEQLRKKIKERDKDFLGKEAEAQIYGEALSRISEDAFPVKGPHYIKHIRALKEIADDALDGVEDSTS